MNSYTVIHLLTYYQILSLPENASQEAISFRCQTFVLNDFLENYFYYRDFYLPHSEEEEIEVRIVVCKAFMTLRDPSCRAEYNKWLQEKRRYADFLEAREKAEYQQQKGIEFYSFLHLRTEVNTGNSLFPYFRDGKKRDILRMNCYQILGLPEDAGHYQILSTIYNVDFFEKYSRVHPNISHVERKTAFGRIIRAMHILSNPSFRQTYDFCQNQQRIEKSLVVPNPSIR